MRRLAFLFAILVAASAAVASPVRADDMTLRWNDCGVSGVALKTFACDTNSGASELFVSFTLSAPRPLTGIEAMMEVVYPATGPVPSWWDVPACRPSTVFGLNLAADFTGCVSPWAASAAGGTIFEPTFFAPTIGRLRAAVGVPPADSASLAAGVEYGALRIRLSYAKTTGAGSCAGCDQPVGVYLRQVECFDGSPQPLVIFPSTPDDSRYFVNWQCEGTPHFDHSFVDGWTFSNCDVATRRPSWGRIKGLYR